MHLSLSRILLLIAVICFVAAAVGVGFDRISLGWLGLAFFAAASFI